MAEHLSVCGSHCWHKHRMALHIPKHGPHGTGPFLACNCLKPWEICTGGHPCQGDSSDAVPSSPPCLDCVSPCASTTANTLGESVWGSCKHPRAVGAGNQPAKLVHMEWGVSVCRGGEDQPWLPCSHLGRSFNPYVPSIASKGMCCLLEIGVHRLLEANPLCISRDNSCTHCLTLLLSPGRAPPARASLLW